MVTNLEVYLNALVEDIMKAGNSDAQETVEEYYPAYQSPSRIKDAHNSPTVSTQFYTIDGKQVSTPTKGIYLLRQRHADGTVKTSKVVY